MRLILQRMSLTSAMSSSASASESLMPPSRTYSKVIHSRLRRGMVDERFEERGDVPLARDGHDGLADDVVGGVEADGQLGADGLAGEVEDAGKDAGGADGHARLGDAHVDEQADGGHEVGVVEEGLAHAHEDEVDACRGGVAAAAAEVDAVAVEDGGDLAGDLAGGEVAADAELRGEAELAVDGAADLAGDADGGAAVGEGCGGVAGADVFASPLLRRPGSRRRVRRRRRRASRRSRRSRRRPCG